MDITIRPYHPDDGPAYLEILNQYRAVPLTLDQLRRQEAGRDPARFRQCIVTTSHSRLVGYGLLETHVLVPVDWFRAEIVVAQADRGMGHGRRLAATLKDITRARAPRGLECWVRDDDPSSRQWAERQGFVLYTRRFDAVLDLNRIAPADDDRAPAGIRFFTVAEAPDPGRWERLYELTGQLMADTPDLEGQPPMGFPDFCRIVRDNPRVTPDSVFVCADGDRWVGLSILFRMSAKELYTFFTGIAPGYRGHGIARALKRRTIEYGRSLGARWMRTDVDDRNLAMWTVNERLGYRPTTGIWRLHQRLVI